MKLAIISTVIALLAFLTGVSFSSKIINTQPTTPVDTKHGKYVELRKGEEVVTPENIKVPTTEVVVTYSDGTKDILESTTPDQAKQHISLSEGSMSPGNKFIMYTKYGWESAQLKIVRLSDNKDIFDQYKDKIYPSSFYSVNWFDNDKILAIISTVNRLDGYGSAGLYISDYNAPEQLNQVIQFSDDEDLGGSKVDQVLYDGKNMHILVTRVMKNTGIQQNYTEKYLYNVETKKLEKITTK